VLQKCSDRVCQRDPAENPGELLMAKLKKLGRKNKINNVGSKTD
jgi:hypothetical protein